MTSSLIQFKNLTKKFGKHIVLDEINLEIEQGDRFGIIGISGSGKTTILNILIGYYKPTDGAILYRGLKPHMKAIRKIFGFATQEGSFYPKLTVMENLFYFGRLFNMKHSQIKSRAKELIRLVELEGFRNIMASKMSVGMQFRLDLACAMIHNPDVLILDEPTEGLDPKLRKEILILLKKINQAGTTLVVTSHILEEMDMLCSKIAVLHNGKIVDSGTPKNLKDKYYKNDEIHLQSKPGNYAKIAKLLPKKDINKIGIREHQMKIYTPNSEEVLKKLLEILKKQEEDIVDIAIAKPSLYEVFESLTKKKKDV